MYNYYLIVLSQEKFHFLNIPHPKMKPGFQIAAAAYSS